MYAHPKWDLHWLGGKGRKGRDIESCLGTLGVCTIGCIYVSYIKSEILKLMKNIIYFLNAGKYNLSTDIISLM